MKFNTCLILLILGLLLVSCKSQVSYEKAFNNCVEQSYDNLVANSKSAPPNVQENMKKDFKEMAATSCEVIKRTCTGSTETDKLSCQGLMERYG